MRFLAVLALAVLSGCVASPPPDEAPSAAAPVAFEAIRFTTDLGAFTVILYPEAAPETVALEKVYVEEGYYVGRSFGRTVPGHVIQITPHGTQTEDERRVPLEPHPAHHFSMGALGIARGADPGSGGPEFFVMDFATSHLDGNFTVWGQVVEGMDVVHRIARVPALDARPHSALPFVAGDRVAIDPPVITATELLTIELPADAAARYPLVVAQNVRVGEFRHSADWPADLAAGKPAKLGWYVRPYNLTEPPTASSVRIRVAGEDLPVVGDPLAPGAFAWTWTPPAPGEHEATIVADGEAMARLVIRVPN